MCFVQISSASFSFGHILFLFSIIPLSSRVPYLFFSFFLFSFFFHFSSLCSLLRLRFLSLIPFFFLSSSSFSFISSSYFFLFSCYLSFSSPPFSCSSPLPLPLLFRFLRLLCLSLLSLSPLPLLPPRIECIHFNQETQRRVNLYPVCGDGGLSCVSPARAPLC